jgi:hypothetical protein
MGKSHGGVYAIPRPLHPIIPFSPAYLHQNKQIPSYILIKIVSLILNALDGSNLYFYLKYFIKKAKSASERTGSEFISIMSLHITKEIDG